MPDDRVGSASGGAPNPETAVSSDNPCPFLRALVAGGFIDGHIVPLSKLCSAVEAASAEKGLRKKIVGVKTYLVALGANGLNPLRLMRSWWSGAVLDELRDGPLDKHGVGSRILDATAHVDEAEIERFAGFGKDREDPSGGRMERGLTAPEIKAFMEANLARAKGKRRWYDWLLMKGEWPVLLDIMGKGDGDQRYLSVDEVRTLFVDRRLPKRIVARLTSQPASAPRSALRVAVSIALWGTAAAAVLLVAIVEFPDKAASILPSLVTQFLPPPLPTVPAIKEARWLDQNWSTEDRHWFHHVSQGTATFPVPYSWFVALEQPGIHLFTQPGMMKDSDYLERFGFLPSPQTIHADKTTLARFGYSDVTPAPPVPPVAPSAAGLVPTPADNFDGLPVGFARLTGAVNPGTGQPESDKIGLTCAACHTGSIRYKGVSVRFDGGPAMVELRKLESATGLSILYTSIVPYRFDRFATRVLGPDPSPEDYAKLKKDLWAVGTYLLGQKILYDKTIKSKGQKDTEEGYGRLDALNRIGNQVFYTDLATAGLAGFEKNLHADDAPVSFPPIWTVPWFLWAQYDASIEQPMIRNAGEALGVYALVNLSPDTTQDRLFSSTVAIENLDRIETMLRGPDPSPENPSFGGLQPPNWPSDIFAKDTAWKIDQGRVEKGRALYATICVECHLGPVNDPAFNKLYPAQSFWSSERWDAKNKWLDPVQKSAAGMGTDPGQANVLFTRKVEVPGFLNLQPKEVLGKNWGCSNMPAASTEMPYSLALMMVVDVVSRKWMKDRGMTEAHQKALWGPRVNCPNDEKETQTYVKRPQVDAKQPQDDRKPHYRARPLNGVWATAPYLHNGSVPSLYWMLMPAAQRPTQFCMGVRDFDPQQVGFHVEPGEVQKCKDGETRFLTTNRDGSSIKGNSNLGHSFEGTGEHKAGIIGRQLTEDERYDLIEYLKTL
ncbi:MAG TPA: di-heme-cytochrome C peroxidase [Bradyrhizobium sp.]|nr:di-heme-cytochrome C peroxidase [Bradyrhizobium sp.]